MLTTYQALLRCDIKFPQLPFLVGMTIIASFLPMRKLRLRNPIEVIVLVRIERATVIRPK